jgi:hypothetical protein
MHMKLFNDSTIQRFNDSTRNRPSTINHQPSTNQGSALAITLLTCAILGAVLVAYLSLMGSQETLVGRSQNWNQAMVVAEAGVEEAMALLNSGVQAPNFAVFPWTSVGGGVFKNDTNRPAAKFGTSYYEAFITNGFAGTNPVIISTGHVPGPVSTRGLSRTICIKTRPRPTFPVKGPLIVKQSFNANGNNIGTDSFDSTIGPYNPATAGANGDVISLTTAANSITLDNGKVKGNIRTPPNGTPGVTATIGSKGSVGDSTWVDGGSTGIQSGHFKDDFTVTEFPDVTLPNLGAWFTPMGGTAPDGLIYDNLLTSGNYQVANLTGSVYVGQSNTVLYVTSSISIGTGGGATKSGYSPPVIHIAPGGSLTVYMAGASTTISGNGLVNDSAQAKNFAYYGLPSNTSISITGNGAFYGTIYAPQADFTLKGGGKSTLEDFTGASITKTTTMGGTFNFHYDESLIHLTTLGGYDPISWEEM